MRWLDSKEGPAIRATPPDLEAFVIPCAKHPRWRMRRRREKEEEKKETELRRRRREEGAGKTIASKQSQEESGEEKRNKEGHTTDTLSLLAIQMPQS